MARLRDIPTAFRIAGPWTFTKKVWTRVGEDDLFTWASAMAYSWLFAVFPFFLVLMTLIPYLPEDRKAEAKRQIAVAIYQMPRDAADTLWVNLEPKIDQLLHDRPKGFFSVGLILTLWAASGGMAMTMAALDRCYDVKTYRPYYKQRPLAVGLTIIVATLILMVLILIPIGTLVTNWVIARMGDSISYPLLAVWQLARFALSFVLLFAVLSAIYYIGPNVRQKFHAITPGAVFSVGVWLLLGVVFRVYIERFGKYNETYGTVGGVAVLLLLFYVDALVMLIGAEINCEIDAIIAGVDRCTDAPAKAEAIIEQQEQSERKSEPASP